MGNVKELNLTKLTTNNVPRNVGKKLNRRYSKKKVKLPVSSCVPLTQSSLSSSGSHQATPLVTDKPMSSSTPNHDCLPSLAPPISPYSSWLLPTVPWRFPSSSDMHGWPARI